MHNKVDTASYDVRRQPTEVRLWEAEQPHMGICGCTKGFVLYSLDKEGGTDTV